MAFDGQRAFLSSAAVEKWRSMSSLKLRRGLRATPTEWCVSPSQALGAETCSSCEECEPPWADPGQSKFMSDSVSSDEWHLGRLRGRERALQRKALHHKSLLHHERRSVSLQPTRADQNLRLMNQLMGVITQTLENEPLTRPRPSARRSQSMDRSNDKIADPSDISSVVKQLIHLFVSLQSDRRRHVDQVGRLKAEVDRLTAKQRFTERADAVEEPLEDEEAEQSSEHQLESRGQMGSDHLEWLEGGAQGSMDGNGGGSSAPSSSPPSNSPSPPFGSPPSATAEVNVLESPPMPPSNASSSKGQLCLEGSSEGSTTYSNTRTDIVYKEIKRRYNPWPASEDEKVRCTPTFGTTPSDRDSPVGKLVRQPSDVRQIREKLLRKEIDRLRHQVVNLRGQVRRDVELLNTTTGGP